MLVSSWGRRGLIEGPPERGVWGSGEVLICPGRFRVSRGVGKVLSARRDPGVVEGTTKRGPPSRRRPYHSAHRLLAGPLEDAIMLLTGARKLSASTDPRGWPPGTATRDLGGHRVPRAPTSSGAPNSARPGHGDPRARHDDHGLQQPARNTGCTRVMDPRGSQNPEPEDLLRHVDDQPRPTSAARLSPARGVPSSIRRLCTRRSSQHLEVPCSRPPPLTPCPTRRRCRPSRRQCACASTRPTCRRPAAAPCPRGNACTPPAPSRHP